MGTLECNFLPCMRSYDQYCALAKALDVVGDRWTLLIVRELLVRPCRYSELQDGLTGIATNLLAQRLRQLEGAGVIGRDADGRSAASTDRGRKLGCLRARAGPLGRAVDACRTGTGRVSSSVARASLELMFGGIDPGRPDIQVEVRTADEVLTVTSAAGSVEVRTGPAPSPDVVVTGPPELIVGLMLGALDKDAAMSQGVSILGDFTEVERLRRDDWLNPPTEDDARRSTSTKGLRGRRIGPETPLMND